MMDPLLIAFVCFIILFVLFFLGMKIGTALGMTGALGFILYQGNLGLVQYIPYRTTDNFVLICLPLFIFMGEILVLGGIADKLFSSVSKLIKWLPGGLLHTNIYSCALFAAISGSGPATAATVGSVSIPSLKKLNYNKKLVYGTIAVGGTLGILIPPSINMVVYGMLAGVSVGRLFAAGFIPGILLSIFFSLYIIFLAIRDPELAPKENIKDSISLKEEILYIIKNLLPIFILMFFVLGGIFAGIMTATEGAALGATFSIFLVLISRKFSWSVFKKALENTVGTTCMIFFIIIGSSIFSGFISRAGIPTIISGIVLRSNIPPSIVVWVIILFYIFLGCFIDPVSILIMTASTVLPIVKELGFDLIWFGVIYIITAQTGMITPPMGINLFVVQGISNDNIYTVIQGIIPFFLLMLFALGLFFYFPSLVLWFPNLLFGIVL